jgi:DNA-binding transcriptional regulator YdaS (Cro superfamily)
MRRKTGIRRAIQIAGTQTHLAELVGVAQSRVAVWLQQGYVPAPRAPIVADVTGVPLIELLKPAKPPRKRTNGRIQPRA